MRKARLEITDQRILEEILESQVICRLAMVRDGRPYLLPFNYGYRDGCLYIHSAPEGTKIEILRQDPEVCFEVEEGVEITTGDTACKWSTRYRSVIGYGLVEVLEGDADKKHGLDVIMAQHGAPHLNSYEPGNMKHMVLLKVNISSMTGKQSSNWDGK